MKRQRSTPWIYRWSRPLMAGIATFGAVVTAYLTAVKFAQGSAACPTSGCDIVLSGPYATVFGLPLALFGFLAYASMVVFAIAPLLVPQSNQQLRSPLESWTGLLLFAGGTAMTVFSGYLMYLLAFGGRRSGLAGHWTTAVYWIYRGDDRDSRHARGVCRCE